MSGKMKFIHGLAVVLIRWGCLPKQCEVLLSGHVPRPDVVIDLTTRTRLGWPAGQSSNEMKSICYVYLQSLSYGFTRSRAPGITNLSMLVAGCEVQAYNPRALSLSVVVSIPFCHQYQRPLNLWSMFFLKVACVPQGIAVYGFLIDIESRWRRM